MANDAAHTATGCAGVFSGLVASVLFCFAIVMVMCMGGVILVGGSVASLNNTLGDAMTEAREQAEAEAKLTLSERITKIEKEINATTDPKKLSALNLKFNAMCRERGDFASFELDADAMWALVRAREAKDQELVRAGLREEIAERHRQDAERREFDNLDTEK